MAKLFELWAELGLDASKFDKGVKSASKQGNTLASNVTSGLNTVSAKTIAMGHALYDFTKTAARTAGNFVKDVVTSFADYEQLVGGVNKMFGDSAGDVIANAQRAYSTAGMNMNEYMQTVTSFSATLIKSLKGDTVEAARVADMALRDMSDNANTFGTDMASIQNAYQGFAKSNYTMLDNLRLGYGGTKTEMQRLLKDAQKIKRAQGENVKYSINNLDDVYEAIHVIQQEMKITGTTASEASQTISGSYHATMAAWSNIMVGMGTEQEMDEHIRGFVESGTNLVTNVAKLLPKVAKSFMEEVVPMASEWASELMGKAADAGAGLLANIYTSLTGETTTAEQVKTFFGQLGTDAMTKFDEAKTTAGNFLSGFYSALVADEGGNKENIITYFKELWTAVAQTATDAKALASEFLGDLYTGITGKEATAENVGETAGGVVSVAGTTAVNAASATTAFLDTMHDINAQDKPFLPKVADAVNAFGIAANDYKEIGARFVTGMYEAVTGDTEGTEAANRFITKVFETASEQAERENREMGEMAAGERKLVLDDDTIETMYNTAYRMWEDPASYGISEDQADSWMDALEKHMLGIDEMSLDGLQQIFNEMYSVMHEQEDGTAAVPSITVNVTLNGEEIGASIEEQVTDGVTGRVMRQFRQAGMVTA